MNLNKLFDKQRELDARILLEKGLVGEDLLDKKILALQVELGELANEWRGFKFWKVDPQPRTKALKAGKRHHYYNPLLEEYVDCLHFILSIGNDLKATYTDKPIMKYEKWNTTKLFNAMYFQLAIFENDIHNNSSRKNQLNGYELVFNVFLSIGNRLGFTWEQIESAYMQKNEINHERQNNGY